jgi:folate-binding protein YgfZ
VLGREAPPGSVANRDYGVAAYEVLDDEPPDWTPVDDEELERLRIRARTPRFGRELDDRVLPAEAGLEERAISFTKGCYPGQEPVARLHYRGHANRSLRVLALTGEEAPAADAELVHEGKVVGRVTSAVSDPEEGVVALAYVRAEVPPDAILEAAGREARQLDEAAP